MSERTATAKREKPETHYKGLQGITETPTGITFSCQDDLLSLNLSIQATRLTPKNGRVHGELTVTASNSGKTRYLFVPEFFDFHSHSYKDEFRRTMAGRIAEIDWGLLIDDVCLRVINHQRKPAPDQVMVASEVEVKEPEYLLFPFIAKNQPNILFGEKGSNKTTLLIQMARYLSAGITKGIFTSIKPKAVNLMWLDFETDPEAFHYDLSRLHGGDGIAAKIHYVHARGHGTIQDQAPALRELADRSNTDVMVIDSIAGAVSGNLKDSELAMSYHQTLAWFQRTTVSIAHPPKNADESNTSVSGAGQFEDLARNVWEATYEEGAEDETGHQTLFHKKPFKTKKQPPEGFLYAYSPSAIVITPEKPKLSQTIARAGDKQKILAMLKLHGPQTAKAIADKLGKKTAAVVSVRLTELRESGRVIGLPGDKWGLIDYGY